MEQLPSEESSSLEKSPFRAWVDHWIGIMKQKLVSALTLHPKVRLDPSVVARFETEYLETFQSFKRDIHESVFDERAVARLAFNVAIRSYPDLSTARTPVERTVIDYYLKHRLGINEVDQG